MKINLNEVLTKPFQDRRTHAVENFMIFFHMLAVSIPVQNQAVTTIANWAVAIPFSFDIFVIEKRRISHSQNDWQVFAKLSIATVPNT